MQNAERSMADPRDCTSPDDVDAALAEPRAILFKYGTHCPISAAARRELVTFASRQPDATVYQVAVDEHRETSAYVAERLGVRHESPQAFVLRQGEVTWKATHFDITALDLRKQYEAASD
jgi:bacillithiol system protein YtxJ